MLAGGRGRRIGGDKALVRLAGRPLLEHVLAAVAAAGLEPVIVAKPDTDLSGIDLPPGSILREPERPRHPLAGIVAGLEREGAALVTCPCDLPLVPAALLAHLAGRPEPNVTVVVADRLQPLLGRYAAEAAPSLAAAAAAGRSATEAVTALDPAILGDRELAAYGRPAQILRGVNTTADLRELEADLAGGHR